MGAIPAPVGGTLQPLGLGILGRPRWEPSPSLLGAPCSTWGWGSWGGRGGNRPHPRWGHIAALGDPGCLLSYCQLVRTFARESLPQRVDKALKIQNKYFERPEPRAPPPLHAQTHPVYYFLPCCLQGCQRTRPPLHPGAPLFLQGFEWLNDASEARAKWGFKANAPGPPSTRVHPFSSRVEWLNGASETRAKWGFKANAPDPPSTRVHPLPLQGFEWLNDASEARAKWGFKANASGSRLVMGFKPGDFLHPDAVSGDNMSVTSCQLLSTPLLVTGFKPGDFLHSDAARKRAVPIRGRQ